MPADTPCADRADYRKIGVPTLILGNRQDPIHPWTLAETLSELIPGAELREVTPKSVSLERHAADVQKALDDFLTRRFLKIRGNPMLKCSDSLWSADLANLAAEIKRVEPYSERFHLDVADGHYVPSMLFFPDLVKALRKHTSKPFEVHLMTTDPSAWVEPFVEAGADGVIFCFDSLTDPGRGDQAGQGPGQVRGDLAAGDRAGQPARPYWTTIDQVTIVGTPMGTKGTSMDPSIFDKIREARAAIEQAFGPSRDPGRRRHPPQHGAADPRGRRRLDRAGLADVRRRSGGDAAVAGMACDTIGNYAASRR